MVVDGIEPETIREILELELEKWKKDIRMEQIC
jgi:flagellar motor component MotA